jgi:hypothetical protein
MTINQNKSTAPVDQALADSAKPFKVFCDDMFHYQDPSARLFVGTFATREEAIKKCQIILMETLSELYEPGMKEEELMTKWWSFGDDPWISCLNSNPEDNVSFSAATQAPAFAKTIVEEKERELLTNN